jgi:phosphoenolpyruvate-protein phosphotransferase (PTS system enzyme I)
VTPAPSRRRHYGIGVSPGAAVGPVVRLRPRVRPPRDEPAAADPAAAGQRIREALATVADALELQAQTARATVREILQATAMMARDPGLAAAVEDHLASGCGPTTALDAAVEDYCAAFATAGGYVAERVTDLRDVGDRAIAVLLGRDEPGLPAAAEPCVLVGHDLAPAETAALDPGRVLAIVTEAGGALSHTAVLAAQLGIPAVVQVAAAPTLADGTLVAVDGDTGLVVVDPDAAYRAELTERAERRAKAFASSSGPGRTRDGVAVALMVNIGTVQDALAAAASDVEGVGLFRTELLFLGADTAPTLDWQTQTYRQVFEPFGDRCVVVRTLDAGADKPLAFADLGREGNPALGRRGLRLSALRPDLLDTQLAALGRAARATGADVRVMAPMVATADEAAWFARRVRENGLPSVGVMIEVPAAALRARHVLAEVDFGSIGTNDLAQYTLAADRDLGELAGLLDPWQPAVLDLIAVACKGARSAGRPIGVCGEAAGDPLLALVLTGLGATSLSMAPLKVAGVRHALALHDLATCARMAAVARSAVVPEQGREAVAALASPELLTLL